MLQQAQYTRLIKEKVTKPIRNRLIKNSLTLTVLQKGHRKIADRIDKM